MNSIAGTAPMRWRWRLFIVAILKYPTDMTRLFYFILTFIISSACFSQKPAPLGQKIVGDFNGDTKSDTAFVTLGKNSKSKKYTVSFSDKTIPAIPLGCCEIILINEGDLNSDRKTDFSVFQAPENGCVYMWTTYSLKNNRWTQLVGPFLISTDCEKFLAKDLEKRVFKENGHVYYWDVDPNDENNKPIKKLAVPKGE
jgi:hypothetical protein